MATYDGLRHLHDPDSVSYLTQAQAVAIDEQLMGEMGFSIDQLMELAGLSVASAVTESKVLPDRHALDERFEEISSKYADGSKIPRPVCWGGFRLIPESIEFWQGSESRLHDRLRLTLDKTDRKTWHMERLAP